MGARILVVDDDECMRELLQLHLRIAGYDVDAAEDALVAGRMVLKSPPDLMLVDVQMPYMNGPQFVAALKADKTIPQIPVIFLTAMPNFEGRAAELGAGYLEKPCMADDLLRAVKQGLAFHGARTRIRPSQTTVAIESAYC
jgi:DNA-binding response OmpR family regulator